MALYRLDIAKDGTASTAPDDAAIGPAHYRWHHFELGDPTLLDWARKHLPHIPAETLLQAQTRPRCDSYEAGLMLNLRGVNLNGDGPADQMVAVRLWVTDKTLVTVRVRRVFALEDIRRACENGQSPATPAAFIEALGAKLFERIQTTVFDLADTVDTLEDGLQDDDPLPPHMSDLKRTAIRLHRYLAPQRDALLKLAASDKLTGRNAHVRRELANLAMLTVEELDSLKARLAAIHDHHKSRADALQGRNSYTLSIIAAIFLPLGFVTGLFGVNVGGMPGIEDGAAFWILCAGMTALALAAFGILRWLRWV